MKSNDIQIRSDVREAMQKAIRENDNEAFYNSFEQMLLCIRDDIETEYANRFDKLEGEMDRRALAPAACGSSRARSAPITKS